MGYVQQHCYLENLKWLQESGGKDWNSGLTDGFFTTPMLLHKHFLYSPFQELNCQPSYTDQPLQLLPASTDRMLVFYHDAWQKPIIRLGFVEQRAVQTTEIWLVPAELANFGLCIPRLRGTLSKTFNTHFCFRYTTVSRVSPSYYK